MRVKLLELDGETQPSSKARQFWRPENRQAIWVPVSVISHISKDPPDVAGWRICHVEVADWFAEKEGL